MPRVHTLTPTMAIALRDMFDAGGEFVRYQGGFWAKENAPRDHRGHPIGYYGTPTIEGIVARGRAEYVEFKERSRGGQPFPVRVRLCPEKKSEEAR